MSKYIDNCGGLQPPKPIPRRKDDKPTKKSTPAKKKVKRK